MNLICRIGIIALLLLPLVACSNSHIRGEFQEDVPGGGQAILKYEMQNGEVKQIIQSTESTKYFVESTFSYTHEELSSVCVVVSEFVYNDDFVITDAKKVASIKWVVGEQGLVLKEGHLDEKLVGKNHDYLAESKRIRELVKKHHGGVL